MSRLRNMASLIPRFLAKFPFKGTNNHGRFKPLSSFVCALFILSILRRVSREWRMNLFAGASGLGIC